MNQVELKVGDIAYTTQYQVGIFEVHKIEGDKIYTQPGGWVYKGNGERLAVKSDFDRDFNSRFYQKFLRQQIQQPYYEIY
jgi:hypothetical protein